MRFRSTVLLSGLMAAACVAQTAAAPDDSFFFEKGKLRVLILSGRNNHDWRTTTPHLRRILDATGRFDVRITEEPSGLTAESLRPYDVLVSDYCGPRWGGTTEKAVAAFVQSGKGLVVVHAASYPFGDAQVLGAHQTPTGVRQPAWPEWTTMVGAAWTEKEPKTGHAKRHVYEVKWTNAAHPIAQGLAPSFTVSDELYHQFALNAGIEVLATALDATEQGGNGKQEPLLWTNRYGTGRVFHSALGHDVAAMSAPGFVTSFARGVEWAASEKVTLPPLVSLDPKENNAVRVMLVTGGHDHEQSFYAVLDGLREIRVTVNPHPTAFGSDLAKAYDCIVLYDFHVADLPESQQKNLRDYVEGGKGLVVLHHAIADYQNWPFWWKDVVGGRYLLHDEPPAKGSTYLHDQDLEVTPVGEHAIVKGLPPMYIHDEAYKGVWHAEGLQVLLKTNHPASDEALAWIGPWTKSRVVYIELGHGREAHENPWYRELVRRSVIWAAGR